MNEKDYFLDNLILNLKTKILDYFNRTHNYIKNLISYKNIDLNKKTSEENDKLFKTSIEKISKAIQTGLNTVGIPMSRLLNEQKKFNEEIEFEEFSDYNSYLDLHLRKYVNKILFEILIEYLSDVNAEKLKNLIPFNLLSQNLMNSLDQFKKQYVISNNIKNMIINGSLYDHVNFIDLSIQKKVIKLISKESFKPELDRNEIHHKEEDKLDYDLLKSLEDAKQENIETLKTPKKDIIILNGKPKPMMDKRESLKLKDQNVYEPKIFFFDHIGKLQPLNPDLIKKFEISFTNFINSRVANPDFLDLENLFYFVSILKLLNITFPFTSGEILEIVKPYINGKIFSSSKNKKPDPINIFYGLAVFSELDLLNNTDLIDLLDIEIFLESELKNFLPEKLDLNFYTILSLKLLEKGGAIITDKTDFLKPILNLRIKDLENYNPSSDIYLHLVLIKLLDKNQDLSSFKSLYQNDLKKLIKSDGSIDNNITNSAKTLLIYDLLELKQEELEICNQLLNYIIQVTDFFGIENINPDFNWRTNPIGYKIELRMLFWALLAYSQYSGPI